MQIASEGVVVRKSVRVGVPIERAFSVFVEEMGSWWPASHHIGATPFAAITVEPRVGGRWYEVGADEKPCEWGTVLAWDPPEHIAFSWHVGPGHDSPQWKYNPDMARASQVDVFFEADGPEATVVDLVHSGLERHGEGYEQLRALFDGPGAWGEIMARYAKRVAGGEGR